MSLGMNIKGIDCCGSHTLFWNGKFAQLYDVQGMQGPQLLGNFDFRPQVIVRNRRELRKISWIYIVTIFWRTRRYSFLSIYSIFSSTYCVLTCS